MHKKQTVIALTLLTFGVTTQQASHAGFGSLFSGVNDLDSEDSAVKDGAKSGNETTATRDPFDQCTAVRRHSGYDYDYDCNNAKATISKGEEMMKSKNLKIQKKGVILKQIGEKQLARLKKNNLQLHRRLE